MNRAIVLSGGGSCGAYEIGSWKAFEELGIHFTQFYGTSIGSINAALMAQGDFDRALALWENISLQKVIATDFDFDMEFSIEQMLNQKKDMMTFLRSYASNRGADISPLIELVTANVNEQTIRASGNRLGLMTVKMPQLSAVSMTLDTIPQGELIEWLMASSACFPAFPMRKIGASYYIDGGFCDNLPIDLAVLGGADEIYAVDLHMQPTHPEYTDKPYVTYITPSQSPGRFLLFEQKVIRRNMRMGYYDAMRHFGRFHGVRYTFGRINPRTVERQMEAFVRDVAVLDARLTTRTAFSKTTPVPPFGAVLNVPDGRKLTAFEMYLRGGEAAAEMLGLEPVALYRYSEFNQLLMKLVESADVDSEMAREEIEQPNLLLQQAARRGARAAIHLIMSVIWKYGGIPEKFVRPLGLYAGETVAALYLLTLKK